MRGFLDYLPLEEPWRRGIIKRVDRQWRVATLRDHDIRTRDGPALELVKKCLGDRSDIRYSYVQAWTAGDDEPLAQAQDDESLPPGEDVVFLGRPKLFGWWPCLGIGKCARRFEQVMCGRVFDHPDGRAGDTIRYGNRRFSRHSIDEPAPGYRRYDSDYAVFVYRTLKIDGELRQAIALAGLGALGTLLLLVVLAHPRLRSELARQARRIAPLSAGRHKPEEWIEVLTRFEVRDRRRLGNLLNMLEESLRCPRHEESTFDFFLSQVEAVAVATRDGGREIRFSDPSDLAKIALELQPFSGRKGGGLRRVDDGRSIDLPHMRFALLHQLVTVPDSSPEQLCEVLEQERSRGETAEDPDGALRKLVHDLNNDLEPLVGSRPVQKCPKRLRYVLTGVRVEIVEREMV